MTSPSNPNIKAVLFDLSGVLYIGTKALPGAVEAVRRLKQQGFILRFVTNTASQPSDMILKQLDQLGFDVKETELFTAPKAARQYLLHHQLRPYCLIHSLLKPEFADINQTNPNCVLLGDAQENLTYQSLNKAFNLLEQGYPLIGIGNNKYYKDAEGFKLDAGAFVHALEWASDTHAIITGKPDKTFFDEVVASTGVPANQCLMIGDDVRGDVEGAVNAGLQAALVRTGKFKPSDEKILPDVAWILDSIQKLSLS
ncbi:TIGR01458 family HAD-type hydrolase [Hydrogenovibrio sp. 3SP14C1]|uniref:TIGR01458 family HAD-type hydrolase n=1 Tax=Hydrogenovibrio sp. 3SP14C1 TaxID=3038774 RepID=UPI002417F97D|nr:TIGR01458 family HAD-type hydrolase [Hydrogenovibrio sp. 3SP14C1]MDG4813293.1 TIGR01458 family HAD-type hydrolase [Hydrogenovibrio sp. 3SP14C1]